MNTHAAGDGAASTSFARYGLILGILTALGPFAIDMYLPGLPRLVVDLGTSEGAAQLSVMSFFAGLTAGQLFYGPVSDVVGRKPPIYVGLGLFVLGSIGCACAPGIEALIALRFLQGVGGCIGMTIGSAITRDLYTGLRAVRLLSTIILVLGVSPILAPLVGTLIITATSWRMIFVVHAGIGLLCFALVFWLLPETRPAEARSHARLGQAFTTYMTLLANRHFMTTVLVAGLTQAGFFAYLSASAFVFMSIYHLPPLAYSLLFAINAVGLIGGSQFNAHLIRRIGAARLVLIATGVNATAALLLCALCLTQLDSLPALAVLLFVCVGCVAFVGAPSNMLAMHPLGAIAGTASALMGSLLFACGVMSSAVVGLLANGTTLPMVGMIAASSSAAFVLCFATRGLQVAASRETSTVGSNSASSA